MTLINYSANFWGDKHIGYNVLYENMKKGEETVQELTNFIKERVFLEEDILKCLGKSLNRANSYISNNGSFVDAWRLTKGILELWTEIQTTVLNNLNDLSRDVLRYQEELTKTRKRTKDTDTLETINLMQTTTTCLQKAKETYNQRCAEVLTLKSNNKEWNATSTKEYLKIRNKMNKAHEEYRQYMEKYAQIRDIFEEKILRAAQIFQEHDRAHLIQMKRFFIQFTKHLEDCAGAYAQVNTEYRQSMEHIDIEEIMLRFIEEKGTGTQSPQKYVWSETDELPPEMEISSGIQSQSSSNSSAIVGLNPPVPMTVNDLLSLDDSTWISAGTNSFLGSGNSCQLANSDNCSRTGGIFDQKSCESDTDGRSDTAQNVFSTGQQPSNSISNVQQQISSWIGRQKLGHWRLKKHSASQSSLPTMAAAENAEQTNNSEFSKSYGEAKTNSFLKRYQKKTIKSSVGDLAQSNKQQTNILGQTSTDEQKTSSNIQDPLQEFGPPPPLPWAKPPPLDADLSDLLMSKPGNQFPSTLTNRQPSNALAERKTCWSTDSSTSDDEEKSAEFQTSKIRQLQIRPLNESHQQSSSNLNVSLDELRSAIGQIVLQKSNTFENDPWACGGTANFTQSYGPLRPALTGGDEHYRRKQVPATESDLLAFSDFSQSSSVFSTASNIARARPRSHTPFSLGKQSATASDQPTSERNSTMKMRFPSNLATNSGNSDNSSTDKG